MQNVNDFFIVSDIQQIGLSQKDFKNQQQQKRISYMEKDFIHGKLSNLKDNV